MTNETLINQHLEAILTNQIESDGVYLTKRTAAATSCAAITVEELKKAFEWLGDKGFIPAFTKSTIDELVSNYLKSKKKINSLQTTKP